MVEQHYFKDRWIVTFGGLQLSDYTEIDNWCFEVWGKPVVAVKGDGTLCQDNPFWYGTDEGWVVRTLDQAVMLELTWNSKYRS